MAAIFLDDVWSALAALVGIVDAALHVLIAVDNEHLVFVNAGQYDFAEKVGTATWDSRIEIVQASAPCERQSGERVSGWVSSSARVLDRRQSAPIEPKKGEKWEECLVEHCAILLE
jgi:hypothetical protein